ncbi:hypothetical protein C7S18_13930 [Ahniella affigens]|uniref:TIR domain-containing protein n=2 Tax=Ahniella affigens TaxID=2021234 RepID=A0A2P1PTR0_9GAMM|nr:hypothetical protein C7S18_13930 [Ahniella affigens]
MLLTEIQEGSVLPVIGPSVVTSGESGSNCSLYREIAEPMARRLGVTAKEDASAFDVARDAIAQGMPIVSIWRELKHAIRSIHQPGEALRAIAGIRRFDLFLSTTPDKLLYEAVKLERKGLEQFVANRYFTDQGALPSAGSELDNSGCDLPARRNLISIYQLLGSVEAHTGPVWEDDYIEYVFSMIRDEARLSNLFRQIRGKSLLLIGAPAEDWIVRFLLRTALGKRLSDPSSQSKHFLAEARSEANEPMLFFFEKGARVTRVIEGDPIQFAIDLRRRWDEFQPTSHGGSAPAHRVYHRNGDSCPGNSVFISYSSADVACVDNLTEAFQFHKIPYWLDRERLLAGDPLRSKIEAAIVTQCRLFLAIVSKSTERETSSESWIRMERRWAATRQTLGATFYLTLMIDDLPANHRSEVEPVFDGDRRTNTWIELDGLIESIKVHLGLMR